MRDSKRYILETLKELKPFFLSKGVVLVALFGSFAKDEITPYSDIDIAIQKSPDLLEKEGVYGYFNLIEEIKEVLHQKFHRNIDIFDLDSNSPFKESIKEEMIVV